MALNFPFAPWPNGLTQCFTTSATASTAQTRLLTPASFGAAFQFFPSQVRAINNGTAAVFIAFFLTNQNIVIPTNNTPQIALPLLPGVIELFTLPQGAAIYLSDISTVASQTYYLVPGEGL